MHSRGDKDLLSESAHRPDDTTTAEHDTKFTDEAIVLNSQLLIMTLGAKGVGIFPDAIFSRL
jgi:hypothetical protein